MKYRSEMVKFVKIEFLKDYDKKVHFLPVIRSGRNWYMLSNTTCCGVCEIRDLSSNKIASLGPIGRDEVADIALLLDRKLVCEGCVGVAISGDNYSEDDVIQLLMSRNIIKEY